MRFQIYRRYGVRGRRWYWRLRATNGEIIAQGQSYRDKRDVFNIINKIIGIDDAAVIIEEKKEKAMTRLFLLTAPLALALTGCATTGLPSVPAAPVAVADTVILDEQAALSVELAYKAARLVVETAVDAGLIKGAMATRAAQYDVRAYAAVRAVRSAYETGNSASYATALVNARTAISAILDSVKGTSS